MDTLIKDQDTNYHVIDFCLSVLTTVNYIDLYVKCMKFQDRVPLSWYEKAIARYDKIPCELSELNDPCKSLLLNLAKNEIKYRNYLICKITDYFICSKKLSEVKTYCSILQVLLKLEEQNNVLNNLLKNNYKSALIYFFQITELKEGKILFSKNKKLILKASYEILHEYLNKFKSSYDLANINETIDKHINEFERFINKIKKYLNKNQTNIRLEESRKFLEQAL